MTSKQSDCDNKSQKSVSGIPSLLLSLLLVFSLSVSAITSSFAYADSQNIENTENQQTEEIVDDPFEPSEVNDRALYTENGFLASDSPSKQIQIMSKIATISLQGSGTKEDPYRVSTAEELDAVRNDLSACYVQTANIDLENRNWVPIGQTIEDGARVDYLFGGSYDGGNYTISNLRIDEHEDGCYIGLFSSASDSASIKNINIENAVIAIDKTTSSYDGELIDNLYIGGTVYAGGIAGSSSAKIENCSVSGSLTVDHAFSVYLGGISGMSKASNCISHVDISANCDRSSNDRWYADINCGGIVGHPGSVTGQIDFCKNYGDITTSATGEINVGGIVGEDGNLKNCINYGDISGSAGWYGVSAGGIAGWLGDSSIGIDSSINFGSISSYINTTSGSSCYAGGLVGKYWTSYYSKTVNIGWINNSYNLGTNIISKITKEEDGSVETTDGPAGRISVPNCAEETQCYSVDTTLVNGIVPVDCTTHDGYNGESLSSDEINSRIEAILDASKDQYFNIANSTVTLNKGGSNQFEYEYTGSPITPSVEVRMLEQGATSHKVLAEGEDYALEYFNNTKVGQAYVVVTGIGDYYGTKTVYYEIKKSGLDTDTGFTVGRDNNRFTHSALTEGSGFYGVEKYSVTDAQYYKLQQIAGDDIDSIKKLMDSEWDGSCSGISITMALVYRDILDLSKLCDVTVSDYYHLPLPWKNPSLLHSINYYHLLQESSKAEEHVTVAKTFSSPIIGGLRTHLLKGTSLKEFLKTVVEKCRENPVQILDYGWGWNWGWTDTRGAHTIVTTSCTQLDDGSWSISTYDPNSPIYSSNDDGTVGSRNDQLHISADYSNFTLTDNSTCNGYLKGTLNNSNYTAMTLKDPSLYSGYAISALSLNNNDINAISENKSVAKLDISAAHNFSMTNASGHSLEYSNGSFSGDLAVYDLNFVEELGGTRIHISIDPSEQYVVTNGLEGDVAFNDGNNYLSLEGSNIESAIFSLGSGIIVEGSNGSFTAYASTDKYLSDNENGLISVSGEFAADFSITNTGDSLTIAANEDLKNLYAFSLVGVEKHPLITDDEGGSFVLEPTDQDDTFSVIYSDGFDGDVFAPQVYAGLESGDATPSFAGSLERDGYIFAGWSPAISATVTGDVEYIAQWTKTSNQTVTLNKTNKTISVADDPFKLVATVTSDNATDASVQWSSSNPNVATVDQNGNVTISGVGTAVVTARVGDSSAACTVIAKPFIVNATDNSALVGSVEVTSAELAQKVRSYELEILKNNLAADYRFNDLFSDFDGVHVGQYDIHFIDENDDEVQWSGDAALTVKIALSNDDIKSVGKYEKLHVHHIDEDMTTKTDMNAMVEGANLVIATTHFSNYAITATRSDAPGTGDSSGDRNNNPGDDGGDTDNGQSQPGDDSQNPPSNDTQINRTQTVGANIDSGATDTANGKGTSLASTGDNAALAASMAVSGAALTAMIVAFVMAIAELRRKPKE